MRIGIHVGHWEGRPHDVAGLAVEAERAGLDSVWTSETWGSDALVTLTWIAARTERIAIGTGVLQMPARSPANVAMATMTLDHLCGGRLRLGLGTSGPQVAEGWHGAPSDHPLQRTREYVAIVRKVLERAEPLSAPGPHYPLPMQGGTGLGKALKANISPLREHVPIYLAAMGPKNVALAAEIADGWIPFLSSPASVGVFTGALKAAQGRAFDIAPMVPVAIGDDLAACRDALRPMLALYVGGMGSRGANFYNQLVSRLGFAGEAAQIQDLFLDGKRAEAAAAVPDTLVDEVALVGGVERVHDRLAAWREAGVTTLLARARDVETVRTIAEAAS